MLYVYAATKWQFPKSVQKQVKSVLTPTIILPQKIPSFPGFILSSSQRCIRNINIKKPLRSLFPLLRPYTVYIQRCTTWFGKTNLIRTSGIRRYADTGHRYTVRQCRRHFFKQLIHRKRRLLYRFHVVKIASKPLIRLIFKYQHGTGEADKSYYTVRKGRKATNVSFWIFFSCFNPISWKSLQSFPLGQAFTLQKILLFNRLILFERYSIYLP